MSELSAFYTLLLRKYVAMPHGTSQFYNSVSVPTAYTTSGLRPRGCVYPVETSTSWEGRGGWRDWEAGGKGREVETVRREVEERR